MKTVLCLLFLTVLTHGVNLSRKSFHDNLSDFMEVINEEKLEDLTNLVAEYEEDKDFQKTLDYFQSEDFKEVFAGIQSLPEFIDIFDYLEANHLPIRELLEWDNDFLGIVIENVDTKILLRNLRTGNGFNGFMIDVMNTLPKESLAALFEEKLSDDDEFRAAISSLQTEEWIALTDAASKSEVFALYIDALAQNGVNIELLAELVKSLFGQSELN